MGNEIFLYLFIACSIIFIALFIYLLRQTIKKRRKAQEEMQKQDLCGTCEHCWDDFPMPLDHYVTHCEILDRKVGAINRNLNEVVPYPCVQCPFDCYSQKKRTDEPDIEFPGGQIKEG